MEMSLIKLLQRALLHKLDNCQDLHPSPSQLEDCHTLPILNQGTARDHMSKRKPKDSNFRPPSLLWKSSYKIDQETEFILASQDFLFPVTDILEQFTKRSL